MPRRAAWAGRSPGHSQLDASPGFVQLVAAMRSGSLAGPALSLRGSAAAPWLDRVVGAAIFVAVLVIHGSFPIRTSFDSRWTIHTAQSIAVRGDTDLDEYEDAIRRHEFYAIERRDGHLYNRLPIGPSLVALPFVAAVDVLAPLAGAPGVDDMIAPDDGAARLEAWIASAIVAATTALLYSIARRRGLGPAGALLLSLVFAFATSALSTASRALWQHGPAMLALAVAIEASLRAERRAVCAAVAGAALAFGFVSRPTAAIPLAVWVAYLAATDPRRVAAYLAGAAAVLAPFAWFNSACSGTLLPSYYFPAGQRVGPWRALPAVVAGHLVSPSRGLLAFSPVLAFAPVGLAIRARCRKIDALDVALASIVVAHLAVMSTAEQWWAGHSFGPRYLCDVLPAVMVLLVPFLAWLARSRGGWRSLAVGAFALALSWSVFAHVRAATTWDVWAWNGEPVSIDDAPERAWDWSDPQMLRGLLSGRTGEDRDATAR